MHRGQEICVEDSNDWPFRYIHKQYVLRAQIQGIWNIVIIIQLVFWV